MYKISGFSPFHKKNFLILSLLCLFSQAFSQTISGSVISVKDGDTIEILHEGKPVKIRLFGIDCPERKQDFGAKAGRFTSDQCYGRIVSILPHGKDKYRRLLGVVILPDGRNLNELLVKEGYTWRYKYSKDHQLALLEEEARNKKKGLWAMPAPVAPWLFRSLEKEAQANRKRALREKDEH